MNNEININEAGIDLGKNDNNNTFNKFFDNVDDKIIVQTTEQITDFEGDIDDDTIYELDIYNKFIGALSSTQQNNPKIQEKYLKLARHLIHLKNISKNVDLGDIEDIPDLKQIYNNEFNVSWIIPIVLDKKKIYKKLDISNSDTNDTAMEEYINSASNKGIQFEDFFEELKKQSKYNDEFNRDKLSFKTYRKLIYDIDQPYIIKKEMKKKEMGYNTYLDQYSELLRYFNIDNKYWQKYINNGPEKFSYEQYDQDGKRVGTKEAQIIGGAYTNIIGLLVLGSSQMDLLDALNGTPWFDRIRMIGRADKIIKNKEAIIELRNHNLKDGDKVMITNSNSEPNIDGDYTVKVINENKFMIPVNTSEGKEGTFADVYSTTTLNLRKITLNKTILDANTKEDYSDKFDKDAVLYLFPEEQINDEEWKQICKKIIPRASTIIENQKELLVNANTIEEMNNLLKRFSIEFQNLGFDDYFTLTEILDEKYIEKKSKMSKFDYEKYYEEIMSMRSKIVGSNKEENVEKDPVFGNKFILDENVVKYYGKYPNLGTDVDSIATRFNFINNSPDHGRYYYLLIELDKVKGLDDMAEKDITSLSSKIKSEMKELDKEIGSFKSKANCEKRKPEKYISVTSFSKLFDDRGETIKYNVGDMAIIEGEGVKKHEDGQIFFWNGGNWYQHILIKSINDLCLIGSEKIKDFDIEKLHCLFKKACKDKKLVRLEKRKEKLENENNILEDLIKYSSKELEAKLKKDLRVAELNLQIFLREIKDTRKKESLVEVQPDIDPIYMEIMKIPDTENRDYLRNLLIKKDGLIIGENIYSIRTGKKICCAHYYYHMKIAQGGSPEYSEKLTSEMNAAFGTEEENGMIFCRFDGRPLMLMDYDTAEGLSKTTGEVDHQRELVIDEEQQLKEQIMEIQSEEKEAEIFECSSSFIRNELLKMGFRNDDVAKSRDICSKVNKINSKTGILLKRKDFISIISDVLQMVQKLPDYDKFRIKEFLSYKKAGVDLSKINPKIITDRYNDLMTIKKTTYVAARLLITYQTLIPPQYPTGKDKTGVIFEGFQGSTGNEFMALLINEAKIMPIHKITKTGNEVIHYLEVGKIKEEIRKSYDELSGLPSIKKMKKDKKIYESKTVREQEDKIGVVTREIPKYDSLPDNFQKEVEKAKTFAEFSKYQKELRGRQLYITYEIIKSINEAVNTSADKQRDDPKSIEMSCCFEKVDESLDYYKYISDTTNKNIYQLLKESRDNTYYTGLFLNGGMVMKHYPPRNANYFVQVNNLGYNNVEYKKALFMTYIDKGIFKGEKHDYNDDGICVITGENRNEILKKEYTDVEEDDLLKTIIGKTVKKIILGGSKEDEENLKKRDEELVDNFDYEKLKEESSENLSRTINSFVDKLGKKINRFSNKDFMKNLKNKVENLGLYNNILDAERQGMEQENVDIEAFGIAKAKTGDNIKRAKDIVNFENNRNRMRIYNLKKYFNNYFRRYLAMVSNHYDPTDHIKQITDIDEATSREIQKYIFDRESFIKNYMTKKDSDLFKKLKFNVSAKVISNINADVDVWDKSYSKVEKAVNFNISHLADVLLYVLIQNLDEFISMEFEKGEESNKTIARFIVDVLDKIYTDEQQLDFSPGIFIQGDYRAQEAKDLEEEVPLKDEGQRMISQFNYKMKKYQDDNYEEVYDELEQQEKQDTMKLKFIKEYKDKFDKDPTDNEVYDYLENMEKEEEIDKEEDEEEWNMPKVTEEGDDVLEVGEGYGEMPQGGEGEDGDY